MDCALEESPVILALMLARFLGCMIVLMQQDPFWVASILVDLDKAFAHENRNFTQEQIHVCTETFKQL